MLGAVRSGRLFLNNARLLSHAANRKTQPVSEIPTIDSMMPSLLRYMAETEKLGENQLPEQLEPRTISDSHVQFRIPLSTGSHKKLEYLSAGGNVRHGKLLEDLDNLAVYVSLAHNRASRDDSGIGRVGSAPRSVVTAAVQRIDLHQAELQPTRDIVIDGRVTYAGTSSMEVSLRIFQDDDLGNVQQLIKANFIMASRSPTTGGAVRVHPLVGTNTEEAAVINDGRENAKERKRQRERCLTTTHPSNEEFRSLHQNFLVAVKHRRQMEIGENQMWQHDTLSQVVTICHPENRNIHGNVFGGFLIRKALELATATAKIFYKGRVNLLSVDDIDFVRKVEIGDILQFTSLVAVTEGKYIQLRVLAETRDKSFEKQTSNVFHFTFVTADGKPAKEIVPKHYDHGVMWLEGKRQLEKTIGEVLRQ